MSSDVCRPCPAAKLVPLTPAFTSAPERGRRFELPSWEMAGTTLGFVAPFTVHVDADWDAHLFDHHSADACRYVLVPMGDLWELRAGRTQLAAIEAGTGGTHDHMFSAAEATAAEASGAHIRSGYIHEIAGDHITIG